MDFYLIYPILGATPDGDRLTQVPTPGFYKTLSLNTMLSRYLLSKNNMYRKVHPVSKVFLWLQTWPHADDNNPKEP